MSMSIAKQIAQVEWWFCLKSTAAKKNCVEGLGSRLGYEYVHS